MFLHKSEPPIFSISYSPYIAYFISSINLAKDFLFIVGLPLCVSYFELQNELKSPAIIIYIFLFILNFSKSANMLIDTLIGSFSVLALYTLIRIY